MTGSDAIMAVNAFLFTGVKPEVTGQFFYFHIPLPKICLICSELIIDDDIRQNLTSLNEI